MRQAAAYASGSVTTNVVPAPTVLSTVMSPPCACTVPCTTDKPSPVPSPTPLVVKNGSNMRASTSADMPSPVSATAINTYWPAEPVGQGQTILVVEDEPLVRRLSVEVLDDAGYQVLAAESGVRAMELLQAHPDIKLLFTDVILGGTMNGRQLADEMLKLSPDVKVLFTTGYTKNAIVHHGRLDEGVHVIVKPFTTGDLLVKVADLLAE